jgi:hypothetical protein
MVEQASTTDQSNAEALARILEQKIGKYFPEPPRDDRHLEMDTLRAAIEKLGFSAKWEISVDANTLVCTAKVTLVPINKPSVIH